MGGRRGPRLVTIETGGGRITVNTRTGAVIRRGPGGRGEVVETFEEAACRSEDLLQVDPELVTYSPKGQH